MAGGIASAWMGVGRVKAQLLDALEEAGMQLQGGERHARSSTELAGGPETPVALAEPGKIAGRAAYARGRAR
jgi:hypothetical protein